MKDKIFMTFLCATLCVVTNAMGADVNWDEVKESIEKGCTVREKSLGEDGRETFPVDSDVGSDKGFGTFLYMLEGSDDWLFVGNDSALMCDTHQMGEFYECEGNIVVTNGKYFFECKTGWNGDGWEKHDPKTCEESEVPDGVENSKIVKVEAYHVKTNEGYTIATSDLCVMRKCKDGYQYVNGKCVNKVAESNTVTGGTGSQNAGISGNSANGGEIEQLGKLLDAETEKFERSKWRDAEGKFNTARLASDSIAAVVLGTAGGLISSKVIKKKQVENGFEDIKCTIGSQEVADWGDEFQVGIQ
ncbi:MAG: hypothetical protein ACLRFN_04010 [Alphaproteobacteria bacterium]